MDVAANPPGQDKLCQDTSCNTLQGKIDHQTSPAVSLGVASPLNETKNDKINYSLGINVSNKGQ